MHIHDRKSHFEIEGLSLRVFVYMCEREIVKSLFKLVKSFCLISPFQISFVPVSVLQLMRRLLEKPVVSSWWEGELVSLRLAWGG